MSERSAESETLRDFAAAIFPSTQSVANPRDGLALAELLVGARVPTRQNAWAVLLEWVNESAAALLGRRAAFRWQSGEGSAEATLEALSYILALAFVDAAAPLPPWTEIAGRSDRRAELERTARRCLRRMLASAFGAGRTRRNSSASVATFNDEVGSSTLRESGETSLGEELRRRSSEQIAEIEKLRQLNKHYQKECERYVVFKDRNKLLHKQLAYYVEVKDALEEKCARAQENVGELLDKLNASEARAAALRADFEEFNARARILSEENRVLQAKIDEFLVSENENEFEAKASKNGKAIIAQLLTELSLSYKLFKEILY